MLLELVALDDVEEGEEEWVIVIASEIERKGLTCKTFEPEWLRTYVCVYIRTAHYSPMHCVVFTHTSTQLDPNTCAYVQTYIPHS